jgi:myo-inositol 2-dehydrogenase / D-chiro-inositol 1-dehydrogenase
MTPVPLALIGAGRMGRMHLQALADSEALQIVSIVEPDAQARAAAGQIDARPTIYADLEQALDAGGFDGVMIVAPTPLHATLVAACAKRGLPILCEKPCGSSIAEIDTAAAAVRDAEGMLQIGYWRRFVPELVTLRERVHAGEFGDILQVVCFQWDGEPPGEAFRAASGGIVVDMGVHELDQIRWLTDSDLRDSACVAAAGPIQGDVDCANVTLELERGGVAVVSLGRYFPEGDVVWLELMGTKDHARVDILWGEDKTWHAALRAQAEDFARCVSTGEASKGATAADARRTLELAASVQALIPAS